MMIAPLVVNEDYIRYGEVNIVSEGLAWRTKSIGTHG